MFQRANYFARRVISFYAGNFRTDGILGIVRVTVGLAITSTAAISTRVGAQACHCPCCGWRGRRFLPFLAVRRFTFNHRCPSCNSAPRHRAHRILYDNVLGFSTRSGDLLYFAPESNVAFFRQNRQLAVKTSNYPSGDADFHIDILQIPFPDNSWDYIVCHHVIEHLSDDRRGLAEFFRILRPGGMAIVSVPMNLDRTETIEYGSPNPLEHDHYYSYGTDFSRRIPEVFERREYRIFDFCTEEQQRECALRDELVYVLQKPGPATAA